MVSKFLRSIKGTTKPVNLVDQIATSTPLYAYEHQRKVQHVFNYCHPQCGRSRR